MIGSPGKLTASQLFVRTRRARKYSRVKKNGSNLLGSFLASYLITGGFRGIALIIGLAVAGSLVIFGFRRDSSRDKLEDELTGRYLPLITQQVNAAISDQAAAGHIRTYADRDAAISQATRQAVIDLLDPSTPIPPDPAHVQEQ